MDKVDIAHLAGLIDGIGTVTVHVSKSTDYTIGYNFQPTLMLKRPKDDNDPILGKVVAYCDENGVRYTMAEKKQGHGVDAKSYEWLCKDPASIRRFLEPMLPHLVTQYERAIVMLEQIIPRMEDGLHTEKEGFYELMEFADMLRSSYRRGKELKYDQDYFAEEWSDIES